jgi:capsular polysaccharide biosynthesis protein/MinD-like ATPase involved in chromosome partitioning or flagellar assembly
MRAELSPKPRFTALDVQPQLWRGESSKPETAPEFDLRRAWEHIQRRIAIIVISVAVGASLSVFAGVVIKPTYTATALIAVNQADDSDASRNGDASVDTQLAMLQSPLFIHRAFEVLSRDDHLKVAVPQQVNLERHLKVIQQLRSRLIGLTFSAKSPSDAAEVANKIARLYVEDPYLQSMDSVDDTSGTRSRLIAILEAKLEHVERGETDRQTPSSSAAASSEASDLRDQIAALRLEESLARRRTENRQQTLAMSPPVQLVALAEPPTRPSSVRPILIIIPATIFSTIFGVALALLLGGLDRHIYFPSDLTRKISIRCSGAIPARRRFMFGGANRAGDVGYFRAIDAVVTDVLLTGSEEKRTVLVTPSEEDEEAFQFGLDLAVAAARMRRRVLLVDLDATWPAKLLLSRCAPNQGPDVFDVLAGRCPATAAIQSLSGTDLDCLSNRHDSEADALVLLAGGRLKQLIADLRVTYDWLILRGPPVIGMSETRLIAAAADATVLLVRSGISRFPEVREAFDTLSSAMTTSAFGEISTQIVTVVTGAPRWSLPAPFRDKRAAKRPDAALRPLESTTQSILRAKTVRVDTPQAELSEKRD